MGFAYRSKVSRMKSEVDSRAGLGWVAQGLGAGRHMDFREWGSSPYRGVCSCAEPRLWVGWVFSSVKYHI